MTRILINFVKYPNDETATCLFYYEVVIFSLLRKSNYDVNQATSRKQAILFDNLCLTNSALPRMNPQLLAQLVYFIMKWVFHI